MPQSRFRSGVLLLAYGALILAGCARKTAPTASAGGPGTSATVPATKGLEPSLPTVQPLNSTFLYLNAKGKAIIEQKGNKQNVNLALRMRRDSIVWLSGSLVGVEGVRAVLTRDSVRVLNRLQREYFAGGYDYLSKLLNVPVTFDDMQALLLGDYVPAPANAAPTVATDDAGRQRVSYSQAGLLVERLLQRNTGRVQQLKLTDAANKRNLTVDYTDFQPLAEQANLPFAHAVLVQAQQPTGVATASINYNKVDAGRERLAFPFAVPKGYRRVK